MKMYNGKCGISVLLDCNAAFDTVVHEMYIEDLRSSGIVDDVLESLSNYLRKKYCVRTGGFCSETILEMRSPTG